MLILACVAAALSACGGGGSGSGGGNAGGGANGSSGGGSPVQSNGVQVLPPGVTLAGGAAQIFTASVADDPAKAGVTWSIGAGPGKLSAATPLSVTYDAPPGLPGAAKVTLTATSIADKSKSYSVVITLSAPAAPASQWVHYDMTGNLVYQPLDAQGDQIMDFSTAGYGGGGVPIPVAPIAQRVSPSGGDDTAAIQAAIAAVSARALDPNTGLRGAVLLAQGNFSVSSTLSITASGVVLRGSGSGGSAAGGTTITMTGATPFPLVVLQGQGSPAPVGSATSITDAYVPSGTQTLHVASTGGLSVGADVLITRPVTAAWVHFMGMDALTSGGTAETWIAPGSTLLRTERTITAISGTQITLDAPVTDSIDSTYCNPPGATLVAYTYAGRIAHVGVESFEVVAPAVLGVVDTPTYQILTAGAVIDSWVQDLRAQDTLESLVIGKEAKRMTVHNVSISHTVTQNGSGALFEEYVIAGATQVLMDTVSATVDNQFFFTTGSTTQGPNVLRNATFVGNESIEPHQRWATGLLVENTTVTSGGAPSGGIDFINRGNEGTGHGWTIGWGVVWNSSAAQLVIQQPPGSENWCIGCTGTPATRAAPGGSVVLPQGLYDSLGTPVFPSSLYQAQLAQRLG